MKLATVALLALTLLPAGAAQARSHDFSPSIGFGKFCGDHTRWTDRRSHGEARKAIDTEDGAVTLLLTNRDVVLQLSDRSMRKVRRELRDERDEDEDNVFANAIKSAVIDVVGSMLDHGIGCRIRDLRTVDYRDGRLRFVTRDGDRLFEDVDVDGQDLLECFSPADARDFVAEFERVKRR